MSRRTFAQLVDAFGNASFECGEWTKADAESYETVQARAQAARVELVTALRKAGLPIESMAAV